MKITLVTIGKYKSEACKNLVVHYLKLASKFATVETVELALPKGMSEQPGQDQALLKLLEKRGTRAYLTLLDERGTIFDTKEFAAKVAKIRDGSHSEWIVAVGGAHGYGAELQSKAKLLWSLSPLTFAHELAAAIAAEQVFRALAILNNHPYHNS